MRLLLNGSEYRITQMGPDFLFVEKPVLHPPGPASIVMSIDDSVERWDVMLPHGIEVGEERVTIEPLNVG